VASVVRHRLVYVLVAVGVCQLLLLGGCLYIRQWWHQQPFNQPPGPIDPEVELALRPAAAIDFHYPSGIERFEKVTNPQVFDQMTGFFIACTKGVVVDGTFTEDNLRATVYDTSGQVILKCYEIGHVNMVGRRSYNIKFLNLTPAEEIHSDYITRSFHFYPSGLRKAHGDFANRRMHGPWRFYREDGSKECEGTFESGRKVGVWQYYSDKGELIRTERYD